MANQANQRSSSAEQLARQHAAREYVHAVCSALGWTPTELARNAGLRAPSTLVRFVNSPSVTHALSHDTLMAVQKVSGIPFPIGVLRAYGMTPSPREEHPATANDDTEVSNIRPAPEIRLSRASKSVEDIPVYGTALCGTDGGFELNMGEAIDYRRRPEGLIGKGDIFALHAEGDSMQPRYYAGDIVLVYRKRLPIAGKDCIVQLHPKIDGDPPPAYLKTLVRRNSEEIEVEQFHPPRKRIIKVRDIMSMHLVVDRNDMV